MLLLTEHKGAVSVPHSEFSAWKETQQESFRLWAKSFSGKISGQEIPDALSLLTAEESGSFKKTIRLEQNGYPGSYEQWNFLRPGLNTTILSSIIDRLSPHSRPKIDRLAAVLGLDPDVVLQSAILTTALLDSTEREVAVQLTDERCLRFTRFPSTILEKDRWVGGNLQYYSLVRLSKSLRINGMDLIINRRDFYARIVSLKIPVDYPNFFSWVLCVGSHAAVGDAHYRSLQEEQPGLQA